MHCYDPIFSQSARRVRVWGPTNLCYTQSHNNNSELSTLTGISALTSPARLAEGFIATLVTNWSLKEAQRSEQNSLSLQLDELENGLCKSTEISHISTER